LEEFVDFNDLTKNIFKTLCDSCNFGKFFLFPNYLVWWDCHVKNQLSQPHFGQAWGWNSDFQSWGLGVLHDSRKLRAWLQGSKHLALGVLDIIGKVLKCRCPKWPRVTHLDICSPSYGQKKGRESNWQFDSRPLKVGNRPDPNMRWGSVTWRWKALEDSYKIGSDLVLIGDRGEKLWWPKVSRVQTGTVSGLHFGSPRTKSHVGVGTVEQRKEYYMGEGGGFPRVQAVVSQMSPRSPVACPNTKRVQNEF
jgi:hypothetical protein